MIPDVAEAVEERLNEAVRRLVEVLRPERIYLFGSRARGDAKEDIDYDLMVVVPRAEGASAERQREGDASLSGVLSPVDLLVWPREVFERQLPVVASFPATIVREGRLLYHDDRPADSMNGDGATPERRNGGPMAAEAEQRRLTQEWIKTAEQDLLVAETVLRHASAPGGVAYHCQQATEKALKGFLLWNEVPFRKTHALKELVEQCETVDPSFAGLKVAAAVLGPYVVQFRYPGSGPVPTAEPAAQALDLARDAVEFVKRRLPPPSQA